MKKLAIVIGGSSGIGESIVNCLKEEYCVINMSRTKDIITDVTKLDSIKESFSFIKEQYGSPNIFIYCAGFVEPQGIREITEDIWDKTFDTNIKGAFLSTQEFIKICDKQATIIYIASTAGTRSSPGWSAYSASKSALINYGLTMSDELKSLGIKVFIVNPGRCATPLRAILAPSEDPSQIMQPNSVAIFIKYLLENGECLSGQCLQIKKDT
jgi:NAD(P)-dependent dehydrogenase (short-subunit alcohol dehydrogenase family)